MQFDVAIIGAGLSGMTAGLLLARRGVRVVMLEAHTNPGGCAGFFSRGSFSFDVGATTWISFQEGGLGHELLELCGFQDFPLERILDYRLCLPDRVVSIPPSWDRWPNAWSAAFPELGENGVTLFRSIADVAQKYWRLSERKPSLPLTTFADFIRTLRAVTDPALLDSLRWAHCPLEKFLTAHKVVPSSALAGAFNMLLQDTTQNDLTAVPTPMGLLGLTLMPYGLFRPVGGARNVWDALLKQFQNLGGEFRKKSEVSRIESRRTTYQVYLKSGKEITAEKVLSSIPVWNTYEIAPQLFQGRLEPYLERRENLDGAFALYLGSKDIWGETECNHYQVLNEPSARYGDGNNFLISLSKYGDTGYAPLGYRSLSISCHSSPHEWFSLDSQQRDDKGKRIVQKFIEGGERLFPGFSSAIDLERFYPASPITFQRFTRRYRGMAGNQGLCRENTFFNAIPRSFGNPRFLQFGETTFPGAGTVAAILSGMNASRDCLGNWLRI